MKVAVVNLRQECVAVVPTCYFQQTQPELVVADLAGLVEVQLKVDGMVCEGCSSRVEEALQKMAGVKKVQAPGMIM